MRSASVRLYTILQKSLTSTKPAVPVRFMSKHSTETDEEFDRRSLYNFV